MDVILKGTELLQERVEIPWLLMSLTVEGLIQCVATLSSRVVTQFYKPLLMCIDLSHARNSV